MTEAHVDRRRPSWLRRFTVGTFRVIVTVILGALVALLASYLLRKLGF